MKTFIAVGIGDMVYLDSILTKSERESITEIYWGCRFGKYLATLFDNNSCYPNLKLQHLMCDRIGKETMKQFEPNSLDFWHFKPDHPNNFKAALKVFNIEQDWQEGKLQAIDAAGIFNDPTRLYQGSSLIQNAKPVNKGNYILFHYPTSSRPRCDIATISESDWHFVNQLSAVNNMKVIVISDVNIDVKLDNYEFLLKPDLSYIVDLSASCSYFAGCDSFVAHLASKVLSKDNLFIKSHNPNIKRDILSSLLGRHFWPHSAEDVAFFYKTYIGY
jgi:hypothetical protein